MMNVALLTAERFRPAEIRFREAFLRPGSRGHSVSIAVLDGPAYQARRERIAASVTFNVASARMAIGFRQLMSLFATVLLASMLSGCAPNDACYEPTPSPESLHSVYVVKRAWHSGVAIAAADWPNRDWPVLADFPDSRYLEFGWGDASFYQAEEETWWLAIRAAFFSTASALHVIGFNHPTPEALRADEVIEVHLSQDGLRKLAASIEAEFKDASPKSFGVPLRGVPEPNRFYYAKRRFFFPRMCNWWTAQRLHDGGCPIAAWSVISANRVIREAKGFASAP